VESSMEAKSSMPENPAVMSFERWERVAVAVEAMRL
jgi:hypothetical protein